MYKRESTVMRTRSGMQERAEVGTNSEDSTSNGIGGAPLSASTYRSTPAESEGQGHLRQTKRRLPSPPVVYSKSAHNVGYVGLNPREIHMLFSDKCEDTRQTTNSNSPVPLSPSSSVVSDTICSIQRVYSLEDDDEYRTRKVAAHEKIPK